MPKRHTQEGFIEKAQLKHENFYDYSKVCYVNSQSKVIVVCPTHGDFEITPSHHLGGVGCRKCYFCRQRNTQDTILDKFRKAHGDRYNYDLVVYERQDLKVTIGCPAHGDFQQAPVAHANGSGCPKCGNDERPLAIEEFIERARARHGDKYDYSQVQYVNNATKVTIICPKHGFFEQIAGNHINKSRASRCPECGKEDGIKSQFAFEYKGVQYRSIKHACQELGKDYWIVLKRLDAGWTKGQAFDDRSRSPRRCFELNGVIYNGVQDAVRQLNAPVSAATVKRRLAEGMSIRDALFTTRKLGYDNGVIYLVTNLVNGKQYVGLTTTSLRERWNSHLETVFRNNGSLIHKAITEFGKDSFALEVIDSAPNVRELQTKEREWINTLNTLAPNGYNVTLGGEIGGALGKPTRLPGDPTLYPTVKEAAKALAKRTGINQEAAEKRLHVGRIEVKKPHGMTGTRIYRYWDSLVHGNANPKSRNYNGSVICDRWKEFTKFYEDMGKNYEDGLCLKLNNPRFPYSKENCYWTAKRELHQGHGMVKTRIYGIWAKLVHTIANPKSRDYRGIPVCLEWCDFMSFYGDMGEEYAEGKILQLVDPAQPYSQINCYWAWLRGEQQTHPLFGTYLYKLWIRIVNQCCEPKSKNYNGSEVCDRWRNFASFCEDMASTYQKGFKLVRVDRSKPYSPENCNWKGREEAAQTHGMTSTKFYRIWATLKHKRTNPMSKNYEGTALCERWQEFDNFKTDMYSSYAEGMCLRLIDPGQSYSQENCQWLSRSEIHKKRPVLSPESKTVSGFQLSLF